MTKATDAWRAWVAAGNEPMCNTDIFGDECLMCDSARGSPHEPDCPYRLMREELDTEAERIEPPRGEG